MMGTPPGQSCAPLGKGGENSVHPRRRRTAAKIVATLLFLVLTPSLVSQSQSELKIKAAFVYNLTKYVEWPSEKTHLLIGVVGEGPMADTLRAVLAGKVSESRPIDVLLSPSDADLNRCDVVYVAASSRKSIEQVLQRLANRGVLTVGDAAGFARQGGIVGLVTVGERVEIQVNLESSKREKLKISSRLLNLATVLTRETNSGN